MLVAGLCFALMSVAVQMAGQHFSGPELVFYRSLFGLLAITAPLLYRHGCAAAGLLPGRDWRMHLGRGVVGFIALATFFHALLNLPMSVAVTLNYASPLWLALLMPWQLGERPSRLQYLTVVLGFAGVVMLLRPWQAVSAELLAGLIGAFSGVMAAFAYVYVRRLGQLQEPEWRTVFWFAAVCMLASGLLATLDGWHELRSSDVPTLLLMGLSATLGQLAMTRAYRFGHTVTVASFAFSTVVFSSLLDVIVWQQNLSAWAWAGMTITVLAGILATRLRVWSADSAADATN